MPHWDNYFDGLKENRDIVIRLFSEVINPRIKKKVTELPQPCIAVHIRMGDFRKLKQDEDFSKVGAVRTPENYFIETINSIRKIHGTDLPVSVFTDGYPNEFKNLFTLKNISMVEGDNDLADLLLLSKSKIIITSAGSTFGYWAGFLSNASVILHPAHATTVIRGSDGNNLYEGSFDAANPVLVESIRGL